MFCSGQRAKRDVRSVGLAAYIGCRQVRVGALALFWAFFCPLQLKAEPQLQYPTDPAAERTVHGAIVFYSAAPVPIDKARRLQPIRLILPNGEHWIRGYQLIPKEFPYIDRWVRVWGQLYRPAVDIPEPVMGTHIRLTKMESADQVPLARAGVAFPGLHVVRTLRDFSGPRRRWVALQGSLDSVRRARRGGRAVLRLRDNTHIEVKVPPWADLDGKWVALGGEQVTVMAEVSIASSERIDVVTVGDICAGEVSRCGAHGRRVDEMLNLKLRRSGQSPTNKGR